MDGPLLVERLGPRLLVRDMGIQSSKVFVIQGFCHIAIQESDKSSHLTGRTLCVTKKLLYTICDVGHPHEMVFIEPTDIFFDEMIGNHDDRIAFELQSLPRVSKVTISVVTLFSLTSEVSAKLFGHILWENIRRVDGRVTEEKKYPHPFSLWWQYQPLLHEEASFASDGRKDCLCLYPVL